MNWFVFLGLEQYVDDEKPFSYGDIISYLKKSLEKLEQKRSFAMPKVFAKNLAQLKKILDLNDVELQIVEFAILLNQYNILQKATDSLGGDINTTQLKKSLAIILDIPYQEIQKSFKADGRLAKSGIVTIDKNSTDYFNRKLEIITSSFADDMLHLDEDISVMIKDTVRLCERADLDLEDFGYIKKDIDVIMPYLKKALQKRQKGVNILLYGAPGTGKTELAKTIATTLNKELFEISYADEDDEAMDGYKRLRNYKIAQSFLANRDILLMYDEAEDIFDSSESFFAPRRQDNKAWLNRMLESNEIPTIWITNNIYSIDRAIVRRFDFTCEVPIPNKKQRRKIIEKYSDGLLEPKEIKRLAKNKLIAPAIVSRAAKVVSSLDTNKRYKVFAHIINNTLKAQRHPELLLSKKKDKKEKDPLPSVYRPEFINTFTDLEELVEGVKKHPNARMCFYGAAGTGKSAFGKYIAKRLKKKCIIKKGSDLLSMWVGGTEQNIAKAFKEAKAKKAVLIFDEVDSFLADRCSAQRSWEITQVSEMLVQMESFDGIFIATTNLMENLDQASLRRFDLKLEFGYLKPKQAWEMFCSYAQDLGLEKPLKTLGSEIKYLRYLTPGDFAAVVRQSRFRPISDAWDLLKRLQEEVALKQVEYGSRVGFMAS
ncbi:AAA ATPase, central region [hydrothermal vent metagenome]|uniref:AAA ATPase, central region n=1 Tax=hydrothermal vent metagenome TaxID=652676 RepID=A0A1W1E8U1_9ZZZZ